MSYIIRFVVITVVAIFGLFILLNSKVFAQEVFKSDDYYIATMNTQIQSRLHNEKGDLGEVITNEVLGTFFRFLKFKLDENYKEALIRE